VRPLMLAWILLGCACGLARAQEPERSESDLRTEWVALELPLYSAQVGYSSATIETFIPMIRLAGFRWAAIHWTVAEVWGGLFAGGVSRDGFYYLGSEIGYPIRLDASGTHQLVLGLSAGYGLYYAQAEMIARATEGLMFAPTVRYSYLSDAGLVLGAGLRALLPLQKPEFNEIYDSYKTYRGLVTLFVEVGGMWASSPDGQAPCEAAPVVDHPRGKRSTDEVFGLELSLGGLLLGHNDQPSPLIYLGGSLMLRAPTLRWGNFLWTTVELGGGGFTQVNGAVMAMLGTRPGFSLLESGPHTLSVSAGLEVGALITDVGGEYGCLSGGIGLLVSPVLRYAYRTEQRASIGATLRFVVPTPLVASECFSAMTLLAFDVGFF
jgi:hypothetical protein